MRRALVVVVPLVLLASAACGGRVDGVARSDGSKVVTVTASAAPAPPRVVVLGHADSGGLALGWTIDRIRQARSGFPDLSSGTALQGAGISATVVRFDGSSWVFDSAGTLIAIVPSAGARTADGVTSGVPLTQVRARYGAPSQTLPGPDGSHVAVFPADPSAGTVYRVSYSGDEQSGTVQGIELALEDAVDLLAQLPVAPPSAQAADAGAAVTTTAAPPRTPAAAQATTSAASPTTTTQPGATQSTTTPATTTRSAPTSPTAADIDRLELATGVTDGWGKRIGPDRYEIGVSKPDGEQFAYVTFRWRSYLGEKIYNEHDCAAVATVTSTSGYNRTWRSDRCTTEFGSVTNMGDPKVVKAETPGTYTIAVTLTPFSGGTPKTATMDFVVEPPQ